MHAISSSSDQAKVAVIETRQAELEFFITQAEQTVKAKEESLLKRLSGVEARLAVQVHGLAEAQRTEARTALREMLCVLLREEERISAIEEAAELRNAISERTWRSQLSDAYATAKAAVEAHGSAVASRAEELADDFSVLLAGVTPTADALSAELEMLRRTAAEHTKSNEAMLVELGRGAKDAEQERLAEVEALRRHVDELSSVAEDERRASSAASERLQLLDEHHLAELSSAAAASHSILCAELHESDGALVRANRALNAAAATLRTSQNALRATATIGDGVAATPPDGGTAFHTDASSPFAASCSQPSAASGARHGQVRRQVAAIEEMLADALADVPAAPGVVALSALAHVADDVCAEVATLVTRCAETDAVVVRDEEHAAEEIERSSRLEGLLQSLCAHATPDMPIATHCATRCGRACWHPWGAIGACRCPPLS